MDKTIERFEGETEIPDWLSSVFRKYMDQAARVRDVTQLEIDAITFVRRMPRLLSYLNDRGGEFSEADIKRSTALAALAKAEEEFHFATIYSNAVVALWSRLESLIREFFCEWLRHHPDAMRVDPMSRVRVRLGDFLAMDEDEKLQYLVSVCEQDAGIGLKSGVDKFESLLSPIGLSGGVPRALRRDMFEFAQIRNAIVHGGGHADGRFIRACPWLELALKDEILISQEMFLRYVRCSMSYMSLLIVRAHKVLEGRDISEAGVELLKSILGPYYDNEFSV